MAAEPVTPTRAASTASSAATTATLASGSSGSSLALEDELLRDCGVCANGTVLREILPAKKCDYCCKFKCQFCTLRVPLIKVRRGLPKAMKSNSRICLHCFHQLWNDAAASRSLSLSRRAASTPALLDTRQRESSIWEDDAGGSDSFDAASMRDSLLLRASELDAAAAVSPVDTQQQAAATPGLAKRVARLLGLVIRSETPKPHDVIHVVDLWMSLFAAAILLAVVLIEDLTLQQRVCFCIVIYGGFLALHPWVHHATVPSPPTARPPLPRRSSSVGVPPLNRRSSSAGGVPPLGRRWSVAAVPVAVGSSRRVPDAFRPTLVQMQERFTRYMNDPSQWTLVKTTSGGKIYEIKTDRPQALIMLDMFVSGISIADFLSYMNRTDLKDRAVWDWNVANFEIVDEFPDEDACIVYNAQKAFLGGLVSSRDFCLLYKRSPTTIIYSSVEHADVPERPHATRGTVFLAGLNCTPTTNDKGEDGFMVQYMVQVDIGGSIPTRLMYNGQVDNMEKVIKSFGQAHKLFTKRIS